MADRLQRHFTLLIAIAVLVAVRVDAAEPARNASFDGEWSLEFRVNTRPGGESFTTRQGAAVSPYHLHFQASREAFRFAEDASIKLDIRESTPLTIHSTTRYPGGVTAWDRQRHRGLVRLEGSGTGEGSARQLKLSLRWIYAAGNGFFTDSFGGSSHYSSRTSEDATTVTLSNEAGTRTLPITMWTSTWELKPESVEQIEVSPDVIVETTVYRSRQRSRLSPLDPGGFSPPLPVEEEIELTQKRQLHLVPRG